MALQESALGETMLTFVCLFGYPTALFLAIELAYGFSEDKGSIAWVLSIPEAIIVLLLTILYFVLLLLPRFDTIFGEYKKSFVNRNVFTKKIYNYLLL